MKRNTQLVNPSTVSAFAVYKNMIPGLSTYEDTNNPSVSKKKKRNRKRKAVEAVIKQEPVVTSPSKKRKKNKKKKLTQEAEVQFIQQPINEVEIETKKKKKQKKKMLAGGIEGLTKEADTGVGNAVAIFNGNVSSKVEDEPESPVQNGQSPKKKKSKKSPPKTFQPPPGKASPPSLDNLFSSNPIENSVNHGKSLFEWLIYPTPLETFFSENWEKRPLHVKRLTQRDYYSWIMSSSTLDDIMKKNMIKFGKNIDITSYVDGVRETHNPEGRALPPIVWDYYSNGCSVRFLNPQTYIKPLWRLNASLQEFFGTFVGANVYLTPPDSQGFAPHYDDIEAFVIQIEGYKRWKLYKPRSKQEKLPRFSSLNFNEETDNIGKPIMDVILAPGDMLYFPRGTIHQAKSVEGEHSLHITLSAYQTNTYADFLKIYLPLALEQAIPESLELRRGLPRNYLDYMGVVHSEQKGKKLKAKRAAFTNKIKSLVDGILTKSCDFAADEMGKKLVWDALPPYLNSKEKRRTVYGDGEFVNEGQVLNRTEIGPDVEVKWIRKHACRLVIEENQLRLYFSLENSLEYHEEERQFLELPNQAGPTIDYLTNAYPNFTKIEDFPIEDDGDKVQLAADLWEKGLLMTKIPINPFIFDGEVEELETEDEMSFESEPSTDPEDEDAEFFEEDDEDRNFINDEPTESDYSDEEDDVPPKLVERKAITGPEAVVNVEENESDEEVHPVKRKNSGKALINDDDEDEEDDDSDLDEEEESNSEYEEVEHNPKRKRLSSSFIL